MNSIMTNVHSLVAQRIHADNARRMFSTMEKLATGKAINRGADNPAGLIASGYLQAEISATSAEIATYQRADAVANVADAALGQMSGLMRQANSLQVQMANDTTLSDDQRAAMQMQVDSLIQSADRIAGSTQFNGQNLFDGQASLNVGGHAEGLPQVTSAHIGTTEIDSVEYALSDVQTGGALADNPEAAQQVTSNAISDIAKARGQLGAFQANHLAPAMRSAQVSLENLSAAYSMIADTDYALQTARLAGEQLIAEAALGSLMIAATQPERIASLLS